MDYFFKKSYIYSALVFLPAKHEFYHGRIYFPSRATESVT